MKKIFLTMFMAACVTAAFSEGYQVNLQSTKQAGMGHVGTAMKLGAESMHFNPAGLSYMDKTVDLSGGASFILSNVDYDYSSPDGVCEFSTDSKMSTPIYLYAGVKILDDLAAGISVTNPYGSGLTWPENWAGAHLVQSISLKTFAIQPTVSYKLFNDRLSLGAGMMIMTGDVSIGRALMPVNSLVPMMGPDFADVVPVQAELSGKAKVGLGYNVGVMFDITDQWTVGASYRSKVNMELEKGTAEVSYNVPEPVQQVIIQSGKVPPLNQGTFAASMPMPANLTFGVSYKPVKKLILSADFQYVFWSAYEQLDIEFSKEDWNGNNGYKISSVKDYSNAFAVRLGGQYNVISCLDVRLGAYFDKTPVNDKYYNPETPGADKIGVTAGLSYSPFKNFSIDASFAYVHGIKKENVSCIVTPADEITGTPEVRFYGNYQPTALMPSVGVSYKF